MRTTTILITEFLNSEHVKGKYVTLSAIIRATERDINRVTAALSELQHYHAISRSMDWGLNQWIFTGTPERDTRVRIVQNIKSGIKRKR